MRTTWSKALAAALSLAGAVAALDGVSVTVHWQGSYDIHIGHAGPLMRHDITNWQLRHRRLLSSNVLFPRIDPRDGSQVAFVRDSDGKICLMPIDSGAVTPIADGTRDGFIDWSLDWIYYVRGYAMTSASRTIRRVNVRTKVDEQFCVLQSGTWRFQVSDDDTRMGVRASNGFPNSNTGTTFLYDMVVNNGQLSMSRSVGSGWHCQSALSPSGELVSDGWDPHAGITLRRWSDLSKAVDIRWSTVQTWGPGASVDLGGHGSRIAFASNSEDWICAHLGWDDDVMSTAGNQVLVNWRTSQKLAVTSNAAYSGAYDCCGDLYVYPAVGSRRAQPSRTRTAPDVRLVSPGMLAVSGAGGAQWRLTVSDVSGRTVLRRATGCGNGLVSPGGLATGVVCVRLEDASGATIISRTLAGTAAH